MHVKYAYNSNKNATKYINLRSSRKSDSHRALPFVLISTAQIAETVQINEQFGLSFEPTIASP